MTHSPAHEGPDSALICFLAEAPSTEEMRQGRPLVGPAGRLFNECLGQAGIARSACLILNVFPWPVRKDKRGSLYREDTLLWTTKDGLTEEGLAAAQPALERARGSRANVFCPLGATALSAISDDRRGILKIRGSVLTTREDRKMVPTIHPAYILHSGQFHLRFVLTADLERVRQESTRADVRPPKRTLVVDPSFEDVKDWFHHCSEAPELALDIEIARGQVSCFSLCLDPDTAISIPLLNQQGRSRWTTRQEDKLWRDFSWLLYSHPSRRLVNQNLLFDLTFLYQRNSIQARGRWCDPMIAHRILMHELPADLGFLTSLYTREPYYKDEGSANPWSRDRTPTYDELVRYWQYNCKDAAVALEIWQALEPLLDREGFRWTYDATVELFPMLIWMASRGIRVDTTSLSSASDEIEQEIIQTTNELTASARRPFNPISSTDCRKYFYEETGIKPYTSRATGRATIDDLALQRLASTHGLREAVLVQRIRALRKLKGTYFDALIDDDKRLRASWNPRGTWTGRLSSSQTIHGTGTNMQNLPAQFKQFLIAG